ncbi:hypothetical protein [Lentzea kentuckyensis]|uniref:hypothetical protein n=1 Tax=Lentzea kentuckyensis TaxID=360086 RepID=UPI000A3CF113|nr:hypothetical protein [Lentzea kentuckyensis]
MSTSTWKTTGLTTERLTLRPWAVDDAAAALDIDLRVFRLRLVDLDSAAPVALRPPRRDGD